jgi:hypothetical protein
LTSKESNAHDDDFKITKRKNYINNNFDEAIENILEVNNSNILNHVS